MILAKEELTLSGLSAAEETFAQVDDTLCFESFIPDGSKVRSGQMIASVLGDGRGILKGERVALNFLQHLSGVATSTARFVQKVEGLPVQIIDTRKTTPGLRMFEKEAVRLGGGKNHRFHLGEMILVKDNHIALAGGVIPAVRAAKKAALLSAKIEVEVSNLKEIEEALSVGVEMLLLDNMDSMELSKAVSFIRKKAPHTQIEASGGVRLENVRSIAATGVDLISIGELTHSVQAVDISMAITPSQ